MNKLAIRLLTLAMLSLTLAAAPVFTAVYAAPDNDPPPPDKKKKKSSEARPGIEQTAFADGYRAAYATIYDRHDYAPAITQLKALGRDGPTLHVELSGGRRVTVDGIASFTGHRPDTSLFSELGVELSPSTEGSLRLTRALGGVTDCLSTPSVGREDLGSGEEGFYLVGVKSFGRASTFLLKTGYAHLTTIFEGL